MEYLVHSRSLKESIKRSIRFAKTFAQEEI